MANRLYSVPQGNQYTNVSNVANVLVAYPLAIAAPQTFTIMGIASLTTHTGDLCRLGVYTNTNGLPDALVVDSGDVATTPAAFHSATGLTITLNQGVYWLAIVTNATVNFRGNTGGGDLAAWMLGDGGGLGLANPTATYQRNFTFGALPNPFGSGAYTEAAATPRIWLGF